MDGVLYAAVGDEYVEAAIQSARSVRAAMPGLALAIATDSPVPEVFDIVSPLQERDGYRAKIVAMAHTPFSRTLMLDADTWIVDEISDLFELLDRFDLAAAHAPIRITLPLDDVPSSFPEFNTGVVAFRRSRRVRRLIRQWLSEYDRLLQKDPPSKDQASFRRALYSAHRLRVATLPPELNLRFRIGGYYNQRVRILHGWEGNQTYASIADLLNSPISNWYCSAVLIGGKLFGDTGQLSGEFDRPTGSAED